MKGGEDVKQERNLGLDVIRASAIFFVLAVHFFLNTGFYQDPINSSSMYIQTGLRMLFFICVPLFLILTGYLQTKKEWSKEYLKKIIPILVIYLTYAILSIVVRIYYIGEEKEWYQWLGAVLNFSADGYAWYVNMYIGLFLISPFLNVMYHHLPNKKTKQALLAVFLFLTALPSLLNGKFEKTLFLPDYWIGMYPVTYYFIGCYIREFQLKISKVKGAFLFLLFLGIQTGLEIYAAKGGLFAKYVGGYGSLLVTILTVLFFLLFYDVSVKSKILGFIISIVSLLSLDMYLASYITDIFVYKHWFTTYLTYPKQKLLYFVPIVGSTFLFAFLIAFLRQKLIRVR